MDDVTTEEIRAELAAFAPAADLGERLATDILTYIDVLLKWNARMNLTAVRDPMQIVRRHFGESLFAASQLLGAEATSTYIDIGSGAGFPGIPLKMLRPQVEATLIESHNKKVAFLREVIRALGLGGIQVFAGRAESYPHQAQVVTLRAVEEFATVLPTAAKLVAHGGRLALLIGARQVDAAGKLLTEGEWDEPVSLPGSDQRVLAVWRKAV